MRKVAARESEMLRGGARRGSGGRLGDAIFCSPGGGEAREKSFSRRKSTLKERWVFGKTTPMTIKKKKERKEILCISSRRAASFSEK